MNYTEKSLSKEITVKGKLSHWLSPKREASAEDTGVPGNILRCGNCSVPMEDCSFKI